MAQYICEAQYPVFNIGMRPLSNEQLRELYGYYVTESVPCVEDHGYEVDVPSEDVFIETFNSPQIWSPTMQLSREVGTTLTQEELDAVEETCESDDIFEELWR
ncbi:hypothetical protein GCM10009785_24160 [Brooklawnia cerclae]|uniref:Uncharacterized protein n=1 Tax=Brooklawnia cerclae TaxID=349934 RepID=A0ABX0SCG9_9ACTN|nr:hypothetical protein [Brooklawnia cerclae]NIH55619.1 hypothetical protein [Brooklawnia cerclae]